MINFVVCESERLGLQSVLRYLTLYMTRIWRLLSGGEHLDFLGWFMLILEWG